MVINLQDGNIFCLVVIFFDLCFIVLVFDFGVGGLLVYNEIWQLLLNLYYIYVFDNVVFFYGEKSEEFIVECVVEIVIVVQQCYFLVLVVIVCNIVSIVFLFVLCEKFVFFVVGVVLVIKFVVCLMVNGIVGLLVMCGIVKCFYICELIDCFVNECWIEMLGLVELVELVEVKLYGEFVLLEELCCILCLWLWMQELLDMVVLGCIYFFFLQEELQCVLLEGMWLIDFGVVIVCCIVWLLEYEVLDVKFSDENKVFCMVLMVEIEQFLFVLCCYGFLMLEKLLF